MCIEICSEIRPPDLAFGHDLRTTSPDTLLLLCSSCGQAKGMSKKYVGEPAAQQPVGVSSTINCDHLDDHQTLTIKRKINVNS